MKTSAFAALVLACALVIPADAQSTAAKNAQTGRLSSVRLLATARAIGRTTPPDGMRFLFLITRTPDATGNVTFKETRDVLIADRSYQQRTKAELGHMFEPINVFDTAEGFFTKQPGMRRFAPADMTGAYVLSLTLGGAPLPVGEPVSVTLQVGFNNEVEAFTFRVPIPPAPPNPPKKT